ncbi:hypothetical protein NW752_001680 [Fusarium irregulare]|uniref:Uncharacterized protein n=1 Tax=Fusarium irregulare TaxID=2494466 RepID=A0A9W8PW31_9HYPO|nr:hypothetical protein NW766_003843 [Fusarium irregulare]KAJ4026726.1 hypothetical protein NW752_001680 [Fusarium irregulare]
MSGLGQKVKEILHKDRSNDDATPHPPGSFPTEDMEPSDTREGYSKKYEHNKLHKADDPRGWTESDKDASRSHGYKDSGVGMTGSEDRTSYKPGQENMPERRDESFGDRRDDTLGGRRDDTLGGRRDDALDRTTESSTMGQKDPLAPSTQEHPYWGDLPSQGGVHNSVIGHGSPEDEARRHRDVHSGATEATHNPSSTLESGTFLSRRDRDDSTRNTDPNAARPGEQMRPDERTSRSHYKEGLAGAGAAGAGAYGAHKLSERRDRDDTLGNTEPYGSRLGNQTRPDERTSDSHYKEGLAGAGAAGAGAYGAHKLNERRHDRDEPRQYDQTADRTQPEEHKQRAFPLLGKDHKEPKEHKEHHHHDKVKDDKEKDSKLGGLFHRKDKDDAERVGDYDNDKHHHSKTGPALGAAGAAGAAGAYAATRDRHDDDNRRDNTARDYQDPSATQHTTKYPAAGLDSTRDYSTQGTNPSSGGATQMPYRQQDIDSHRGRDLATGAAGGAAAGLGAGALASHYGRRDDDRTANQRGTGFDNQSYDPSATSQKSGSQHMHGLSAPAVADERYDSQANQPTNFSHKDPMGQNQQHDSHRGAGLAAGTAAGLGAGALASRSGRDHDRDDRSGLESNRGYENQSAYPTEGSAMNPSRGYDQQHDSHRGTGMAAGTAAGLGAAGLASHAGRDNDRNERSGLGSNQGFQSQDPYSSERSAMNPGSQSYEQQDSHRGMGLGAGTAAGLGAGALASRAGRDHDEKSGLGSNRGFNSQDPYSSERSAMNPGSQDAYSSERSAMNPGSEQRDSHRGPGLATGAAAGLGAGALASHAADHRRENDQFNTGNNNRGFQSQSGMTGSGLGNQMGENTGFGNQSGITGMGQNTRLGNQSGMTENTGMMGNTSGNDFSNKQSMPGAQPERESEPFTERKKEHDHTLMDNANSGKYNKLSSGTPSGIAYD